MAKKAKGNREQKPQQSKSLLKERKGQGAGGIHKAADERLDRLIADVLEQPQVFLMPESNAQLPTTIREALKALHDTQTREGKSSLISLGPISNLLLEGFDDEQVWEEIQLRNAPVLRSAQQLMKDPKQLLEEVTSQDKPPKAQPKAQTKAKELPKAQSSKKKTPRPEDSESEGDEEMDVDDIAEEDEGIEEELDEKASRGSQKQAKKKSHPSDDKFFSVDEMEAFIKAAEDGEDEGEEIDYFQDIGSDMEDEDEDEDEGEGDGEDGEDGEDEELAAAKTRKGSKPKAKPEAMKYTDFFGAPRDGSDDFGGEDDMQEEDLEGQDEDLGEEDEQQDQDGEALEEEDEEERKRELEEFERSLKQDLFEGEDGEGNKDDDESNLSAFERKQRRLKEVVQKLEEESLGSKHWSLAGEVGSKTRPINSLLEEDLDFEHATKTVPVITEEVTKTLEERIKKRIIDGLFDDVERKYEDNFGFKPKQKIELDHEKSKKGLGEIYEEEYVKLQEGGEKLDEKLEKIHDNISTMFRDLCFKLDALSNYHFTPKPPREEIEVVTNVPAIAIEEVIPGNVAESTRLAPEEIYNKKSGQLKGESETTVEERHRLRAAKKRSKRRENQEKEQAKKLIEKANPGLGNKHAKEKSLKELQATSKNVVRAKETDTATKYSSSSSVFSRLQDETSKGPQPKKKQEKPSITQANALRL